MPPIKSLPLTQLRGLTAIEVSKLNKLGLRTTSALVKAAPNTRQEQALAKKAGIPLARMREAVNRADLVQLKGLGPANADLLENAGVNSTKELAKRNPQTLAKSLAKYVDSHRELNYRAPDVKTVAVLVDRARSLYATHADVSTLEQAKDKASAALTAYINEALFTDDPRGASYRHEILDGHTDAEKATMQRAFLAEIPAYVGRGTSPLGNTALDTATEDAEGFQFVGRLNGLYTELKVLKPDGRVENLLVEID